VDCSFDPTAFFKSIAPQYADQLGAEYDGGDDEEGEGQYEEGGAGGRHSMMDDINTDLQISDSADSDEDNDFTAVEDIVPGGDEEDSNPALPGGDEEDSNPAPAGGGEDYEKNQSSPEFNINEFLE